MCGLLLTFKFDRELYVTLSAPHNEDSLIPHPSVTSVHRPEYLELAHELFFDRTRWENAPLSQQVDTVDSVGSIVSVYGDHDFEYPDVIRKTISKFGATLISRRFRQVLTEEAFCKDNNSIAALEILQPFCNGEDRALLKRFMADGLHIAMARRAWSLVKNPLEGQFTRGFVNGIAR